MSSPLIVDSRLKDARYESATCPKCKRDLEFLRPPSSSTSTSFKVKCAACQALIEPPTTSTNATKSTGVPAKQAKSRRIGTDEAPLDRSYYEVSCCVLVCLAPHKTAHRSWACPSTQICRRSRAHTGDLPSRCALSTSLTGTSRGLSRTATSRQEPERSGGRRTLQAARTGLLDPL